MMSKLFVVIKATEPITSAIKVFLVEDNVEVIKEALADCNTNAFLLNEDSFDKLQEGMMIEPALTFGILIDTGNLFDEKKKDDLAVLAVDYISSALLPEFQPKPCPFPLKHMKDSVRVINAQTAKLDLIDPGRIEMAKHTDNVEGYTQAAVDSALWAFDEIQAERPYYSVRGGFWHPQGTFYRMLFTREEYDDLVKESHTYMRIL